MYSMEFLKYQENRFDSFCRILIRNSSLDNRRARKRREDRFSSFDELQDGLTELNPVEDTYITYSKTYRVKGIEVNITDDRIGEAVQYIMPNQRGVLLLSWFGEWSDTDIARLLGISHKTVAYRKQMAMQKLKELLEAKDRAKKEN